MLISVINDKGLRFNVRLVRKGERYGQIKVIDGKSVPCLVNGSDDPLVEFYDDRHKIDGEIGQFVQRYNRSILLGVNSRGLCLQGGVPDWEIDGVALEMVCRALRAAQ